MNPRRHPGPVDWTRFRTVGVDLLIVGVLVLVVAFGFALSDVCTSPGVCHTDVNWPTLSPGLVLAGAGVFLTFMSRRKKRTA